MAGLKNQVGSKISVSQPRLWIAAAFYGPAFMELVRQQGEVYPGGSTPQQFYDFLQQGLTHVRDHLPETEVRGLERQLPGLMDELSDPSRLLKAFIKLQVPITGCYGHTHAEPRYRSPVNQAWIDSLNFGPLGEDLSEYPHISEALCDLCARDYQLHHHL